MHVDLYRVNILGLSHSIHHFDYQIDEAFFDHYGKGLIETGNFNVKVSIDKRETFLEAEFEVAGAVQLICDRSLDSFDFPIKTRKKMVFKYGEEEQELSDEIQIIQRDTVSLDLGQLMYEFIALSVPMKKLHPRYNDEDPDEEKIIYTSSEEKKEEGIDPRWDILKKLK